MEGINGWVFCTCSEVKIYSLFTSSSHVCDLIDIQDGKFK